MRPLRKLLENHALANVTYVLVLVLGLIAYWQLPRAQYPEVNLNWVVVVTALPAASSQDVEHLVTVPLEAAARRVADIRFVASTSRENVSTLMIRFREMPAATFAARVDDLRRELQFASTTTLPRDARPPQRARTHHRQRLPQCNDCGHGEGRRAADGPSRPRSQG